MAIQSIKKLEDYSPAPAGANQQIQYNNNGVLGASSNLTFDGSRLDVTGEMRASTGILFGTDTAAVNRLDDYEEGTWTPAWQFGGVATGISYSTQGGVYVKMGNFVFCSFVLDLTSKGTNTGTVQLTGLPFDVLYSGVGDAQYVRAHGNATYAVNFNSISMHLQFMGTGTSCEIYQYSTSLDWGNFSDNSYVRGWIAYRIF